MTLFEYIGNRIKDLRKAYGSEGLSQEALANGLKVAPNTVSRWETATYKPTVEDLERLARFFGVSILTFFPTEEVRENNQVTALLRAAQVLNTKDLEELRRYAEFRQARNFYAHRSKPTAGRKRREVSGKV